MKLAALLLISLPAIAQEVIYLPQEPQLGSQESVKAAQDAWRDAKIQQQVQRTDDKPVLYVPKVRTAITILNIKSDEGNEE